MVASLTPHQSITDGAHLVQRADVILMVAVTLWNGVSAKWNCLPE